MTLNESIVEDAALAWFGELGYPLPFSLCFPCTALLYVKFIHFCEELAKCY
jgi:hypothetical protein